MNVTSKSLIDDLKIENESLKHKNMVLEELLKKKMEIKDGSIEFNGIKCKNTIESLFESLIDDYKEINAQRDLVFQQFYYLNCLYNRQSIFFEEKFNDLRKKISSVINGEISIRDIEKDLEEIGVDCQKMNIWETINYLKQEKIADLSYLKEKLSPIPRKRLQQLILEISLHANSLNLGEESNELVRLSRESPESDEVITMVHQVLSHSKSSDLNSSIALSFASSHECNSLKSFISSYYPHLSNACSSWKDLCLYIHRKHLSIRTLIIASLFISRASKKSPNAAKAIIRLRRSEK